MAFSLVQHIWERLNTQSAIDIDFSTMVFSFIDEKDKSARIELLKDYFDLNDEGKDIPTAHL